MSRFLPALFVTLVLLVEQPASSCPDRSIAQSLGQSSDGIEHGSSNETSHGAADGVARGVADELAHGAVLAHGAALSAVKSDSGCERALETLPEIARQTLERHFLADKQSESLSEFASSFPLPDQYKRSAGLFITLSKNGKTRACWGSIHPEHKDLVSATVFTTESALTREYRFPPIKRSEVKDLKAQVTVVKAIEPIRSYRALNPLKHGLFVRSGARAAVILPGEAKDAYYQLVLCKLKAGIPSGSACQLYRIQADVFR